MSAELKELLGACAAALENHDIETATRLWQEIMARARPN